MAQPMLTGTEMREQRMQHGLTMFLLVVLFAAGVFAASSLKSHAVDAYSCGDQYSHHCYAEMNWIGGAIGSSTQISVQHLYTPAYYDGTFVDDEMWLAAKNSGCSINGYCWVEVGYDSLADGSSISHYFWADERASGGYYEHDLGAVPSGDYGKYTYFDIYQRSSVSWQVDVSSSNTYLYGVSSNNPISPDLIQVGQELAGSGTVYPEASKAPRADFIDNQYKESNGWSFQDYYNYNLGSGFAPPGNPPYGGIVSNPHGSSNSGGDIDTSCC